MLIKQMKSDSLGRRTDRVKKREVDQMMRLHNQGMTEAEIALKLKRKPQTVKRHLEVALLPYEKGIFPPSPSRKAKGSTAN